MKKYIALVVGFVVALVVLPATAAFATHVEPIFVSGNQTCKTLLDNEEAVEIKIEPVVSGTYGPITITVNSTASGQTFDWTSTIGIDAVFVKGGPDGNLYSYVPPATSDTGLHAPLNTSNGRYYGLSHISFCYIPIPSTILSLSGATSPIQIHTGDDVTLTFAEQNDGTEVLDNPSVTTDNVDCVPGYTSGDTNGNGDLDPGETFLFSCTINDITSDVTVVATGHGTFNGKDVTFCADPNAPPANTICDQQERTSVTIDVISPATTLGLSGTSDPVVIIQGGSAVLTFAEDNTGDVELESPNVTTDAAGCTPTYLSGDTNTDGDLDTDETWLFRCTMTNVQDDVTVVATGHGIDPLGFNVTWCADPANPPANTVCDRNERTSVRVDVRQPGTSLSLSGATSPIAVSQGDNVVLTFAEVNDGDTELTNPHLTTDNAACTPVYSSGDTNGDGDLDTTETWLFTCTVTNVQADVTITAFGHGTAFGFDFTHCADPANAPAGVRCDQEEIEVVQIVVAFEGCTPGFWRNHTSLWDGVGTDDVTPYSTTDSFNTVFGVTSAQSGLADTVTLLDAVNLTGGGLRALARHAAAALLNASSSVDYQYSDAQVISIYQDAVGAIAGPETVTSAHAKFQSANEAGCPLN